MIIIGATALAAGILLLYVTPGRRSAAQVARDAGSAREEKGLTFDRIVRMQRIIYGAIGVFGLGALAVGARRRHSEENG